MKLTRQMILDARTDAGGWTMAQIQCIGIKWPPYKGWIDDLVGKEISQEKYDRFVEKKNVRRPTPKNKQ